MRLFKTPTDWELQLSEGSSGIKDLGKESDLLLKNYKSFQLNPFTFQCTKCDGHFECDIFDYAEYNEFYSSYEDNPDSLDFLCSSCSESDFNFTIMGNLV